MQYAKEHTVLPPKPNYKRIEEFVLYVNSEAIKITGIFHGVKCMFFFLGLRNTITGNRTLQSPKLLVRIATERFNSRKDLLGRSNFEQVIDNETDTTIYSFNKLVSLLENCNPNTVDP